MILIERVMNILNELLNWWGVIENIRLIDGLEFKEWEFGHK